MNKKELYKLKKNLLISTLVASTLVGSINLNKNTCYASEYGTGQVVIDHDNRPQTIDDIINYYCKVFSLDTDIVKEKLYDMTYNFHSPGWQHGYCINNIFYDNMEYALLTTIRDIYYNPEAFDLDESIRTNEIYETDMEIEEMVYKYSSLYGINKEVALSIVYCECGSNVNSSNYLNNNNPAGIGPFMHFLNKEVGVIYFCNMLKDGYGCTRDSGEDFLNSIASTYCEIPDHWLDLTLPFYRNLCNDYLCYIDQSKRYEYDINDYDEYNELKLK